MPLQYSCPENSMVRGAWWAQESDANEHVHTHTHTHTHTDLAHQGAVDRTLQVGFVSKSCLFEEGLCLDQSTP